jgi:hypothetical protein
MADLIDLKRAAQSALQAPRRAYRDYCDRIGLCLFLGDACRADDDAAMREDIPAD